MQVLWIPMYEEHNAGFLNLEVSGTHVDFLELPRMNTGFSETAKNGYWFFWNCQKWMLVFLKLPRMNVGFFFYETTKNECWFLETGKNKCWCSEIVKNKCWCSEFPHTRNKCWLSELLNTKNKCRCIPLHRCWNFGHQEYILAFWNYQ